MQYKTIVLEMLQEQTELHELLRTTRALLPMLETFAQQLKDNHEGWKEVLSQAKPDSDHSQINSQALELAIKELENRLQALSPQDDGELPTLDNAIAFLVGRMSIN